MRKNELARQVGVTAAAISQYELGQVRPSAAVLARLALALSMPVEFFAAAFPAPAMAGQAHFRSLRATSQAERDQAEAFGEIARRVVEVIESHIRLPELRLPHLDLPDASTSADLQTVAASARDAFSVGAGPVGHMVRLLEAHGVIVLTLPEVSDRVDAFSHWYGQRPYVFASPSKNDKARSRMDAAHELAHLLLHHDAEPGSQILERQATAFASEFLAPTNVLGDELPTRLDFDRLHELKRRWGISLKALIYRGHAIGVYREHSYRRGMNLLAEWGDPEPGDIGPRETPSLLGKAVDLLAGQQFSVHDVAAQTTLPTTLVQAVIEAGSDPRPRLTITAL
ncbi:ImmA/IrrE family metallo-endopeptidase [Planosporangium thailandense]|uniref:ImmA/IrrE family metallo-endopeptidase n=2 Tax=Planosporangium thailandense TaxID=765197 RepID=A0ABX0XXU6_9ACTN|nr:ImmA/IrrE family metallo-endopeptidase [Planosporangium thailandense]